MAIEQGASEIGVAAFVGTLCICVVFVPMFFLSGMARFLFVPLAEAVVLAMIASCLLPRTLVPRLVVIALSGRSQTAPAFWLNPANGVVHNIAVQTPQYQVDSLDALLNMPAGTGTAAVAGCASDGASNWRVKRPGRRPCESGWCPPPTAAQSAHS